MQKYAMSVNN